jgi:hypothetical protein
MFSTLRDFTRNVKNWSSGDMKKRWIATGVITAERSFIRIKGYQHMLMLIAKLREHAVNNLPILYDSKQQVCIKQMLDQYSVKFNRVWDILAYPLIPARVRRTTLLACLHIFGVIIKTSISQIFHNNFITIS